MHRRDLLDVIHRGVAVVSQSLLGKTIFITGGSRGIGLAIALRAARDGANVAIAAKTATPHASLPGTIHSAAALIDAAGGQALALECDVREEAQVDAAIARTVERFGGIDICINNASAIRLTPILDTPMKRFDLMQQVNARVTYMVTQKALPHLLNSANPHVLAIAPPLSMEERWFAPHVGYTISKFGMSLVILGVAGEFRGRVGVNALWPRTAIDTAALSQIEGHLDLGAVRSPQIMADAAWYLMTSDARITTGQFFVDDELLALHGVNDLSGYGPAGVQDVDLAPDFFVPSLRELRGLP